MHTLLWPAGVAQGDAAFIGDLPLQGTRPSGYLPGSQGGTPTVSPTPARDPKQRKAGVTLLILHLPRWIHGRRSGLA